MAAHRKPPSARIDNRPSRRRGPPPVVTSSLGNARADMPPAEAAAWKWIAEFAPIGVLTSADSLIVEIAAYLWVQYRREGAAFSNAKLGILLKLLRSFGLTPAGRQAMSIPLAPTEPNPYDQFHN